MPYHIKKPSLINASVDVYYTGNRRWTDDYSERKIYSSNPNSQMTNTDGTNGGWTGATVVSE